MCGVWCAAVVGGIVYMGNDRITETSAVGEKDSIVLNVLFPEAVLPSSVSETDELLPDFFNLPGVIP